MKNNILGLLRVKNPAFTKFMNAIGLNDSTETMTVQSTILKVGSLLIAMLITATMGWYTFTHAYYGLSMILLFSGIIGGLISGILTCFRPTLAPKTAFFYAACQGLVLGTISVQTQMFAPGIVPIAICLTSCTTIVILLAYLTGLVKATENFKLMIFSATASIAFTYMLSMILSLFGIKFPVIHDSSIYGIIFSLIVVAVAAFNLVLDFDLIEEGAANRLPKYMEWYAAFSVLVTLIWLYLEILKLLSKLARRNSK